MPQSYEELVARIIAAAKVIVDRERTRQPGAPARRDQHAKHHGCLWAYLDVLPDLPEGLRVGVFAEPKKRYAAWIRPSNSSPRPQPDTTFDGRGLAIKLLEVDGERAESGSRAEPRAVTSGSRAEPRASTTQDFILLNHSAFFAEDLAEMADIFTWQAEGRWLPWYFVRNLRLRGLWAIKKLATKPDSPLDLTYYSQTASVFGAFPAVKYRLRPIIGIERTKPTRGEKASGDHLRHVLRRQLAPNEQDRQRALVGTELSPEDAAGDAIFAFELQFPRDGDEIERTNVSWSGPFVQVALLRIPRQDFDSSVRMKFAERMSFSVWNALRAHQPAGLLNRARAEVYAAISAYRSAINEVEAPAYTRAEWEALKALPAAPVRGSEKLDDVLDALTPPILGLPLRLLASRLGSFLPLIALGLALSFVFFFPQYLGAAVAVEAPLRALGFTLPSEDLIPPARPSDRYARILAEKPAGYRPDEAEDDPVWLFRYGSMGAEFSAGIPYWIYRVLPRVAPDAFGERKDWSEFGLSAADDQTYYESYHELPRGLALSDTLVTVGNQDYRVKLKRVALNCASCHRGEYRDQEGAHFIDGMPNLAFDAAAFKRKTTAALTSASFTVKNVLEEIDRVLAEDHAKAHGAGPAHRLNLFERAVYTWIVQLMQKTAHDKEVKLAWLDRRPLNGPGRLDAFGAFRYESLGLPDSFPGASADGPQHIATVDLPSIWQQGENYRPRHHYDGNTDDSRARNVGAIVGVGGHPLSVRLANVKRIGTWIDRELSPPHYPFAHDPQGALRGKEIYNARCSSCHGSYDEQGKVSSLSACMRVATKDLAGTDSARLRAVDAEFVAGINAFGERNGLWSRRAFSVSQGYLCPPLDGIWARAPYLHNGSVPTLEHLLSGQRPARFVRGNPEYDTRMGGFVWDREPTDGRPSFSFDTTMPGNLSHGHDSDAQIVANEAQRRDLIAYLYSL